MLNVTSQYPTQTFLSPATSQIQTQINTINTSNVGSISFPLTFTRTAFAGTAPDGSLAKMFQVDALITPNAVYGFSSIKDAQARVLEAAAAAGNEYYIELSPLQPLYYQILTWASNI
jgi:hypothetical protein